MSGDVVRESMRLGRRLDVRLRMALLAKLPHLDDRYFRSRPLSDLAERSQTGAAMLPKVLLAARIRVVTSLRGLMDTPVDDRFLASCIFAGRVRRQRQEGRAQWVARPEPTAPLSGIVLSLFAVDVLAHRELYDRDLCVCDTCGRVSFLENPGERRSCHEHAPSVSGYVWKATPRI